MCELNIAKKKVSRIDQLRFERALAGSDQEFQHVFQLLSLLLHFNNPALPGYVINAPSGICQFKPNTYQQKYLSSILPVSPSPIETEATSNIPLNKAENPPILGVYAMGSTGSITQTSRSDLDIWICIQPNLTPDQQTKLTQKTTAIQVWAKNFGVDINFYLLTQQRFRGLHLYHDSITSDNCGSSQSMLLLDEFYRSVIRLAGKPLLWLHLDIDDKYYEEYVENLINENKIDPNEWVDFGGLGSLSANEYFGATLWHLYKGIDSPYKSALKILLVECYSWEYPNTKLISSQFKQDLLRNQPQIHNYDPYFAMLERVSTYLYRLNDLTRLEQVRRCFYIKSCEDILTPSLQNNWRLKQLTGLAQQWGWQQDEIETLNHRQYWKVKQVKKTYEQLVTLLMQSYRNLMNFGQKYNIKASIMPEDICILTRKLYAVFEELPGKVTLFNPQISQDIVEENLTFIESKGNNSIKAGWYILNQAPKTPLLYAKYRHIEYNRNLNKLVCWAYFNGLLTANTQLYIKSPNVNIETLRQFVTDLRLSFNLQVPPAKNEELNHPCEIKQLFIAINLSNDPTKINKNNHFQTNIQPNNLFNFSNKTNLIGSIDLTYRNLWNEIRTLHFEGENAIFTALKVLSNKIYRSLLPPQSVNIFCYSQNYCNELQQVVSYLVGKCINSRFSRLLQENKINRFNIVSDAWNSLFNQYKKHPKTQEKEANRIKTKNKINYPQQIESFANEGFLQFFFEDNSDSSFNVYILDEENNLETYYNCSGQKNEKITEINRIYNTADKNNTNKIQLLKHNFNFPQFYQLIHQKNETKIIPYHKLVNK
ncbi:adenylate cyclase [Mergibacter septicus]|uniref:class I adenylate cyclase n=1 Tax=Mergibacter septicus TaxID=221402 RepID=UPI001C791E2B|nr:class I adenylate cyclase [Mergibacter septicus]QDJ13562.1 adenylate cyclase [Mergibacter septicus]